MTRPLSGMDLTEEMQLRMLGGDASDHRTRWERRGIWGKAAKLSQVGGKLANTFVRTEPLDFITPIAFQLTFSTDNVTYSPFLPSSSNTIKVSIVRSIDETTGSFNEAFLLAPGEAQAVCQVIARALSISVELQGENPGDLFVHCAAAPVTMLDCEAVSPSAATVYTDVEVGRYNAVTVGPFLALAASPNIRNVVIQNNTTVDLYIGLGAFIPSAASKFSTIVLPGSINAAWEIPGDFRGNVRADFAAGGSASDYATFTAGLVT